LGYRYSYKYDDGGNILSRETYTLSGTLAGTPVKYEYQDAQGWNDLLTSYNGQAITYYPDTGNPQSYRGSTLTWKNGRQLASYGSNTYNYDYAGIRTSKTVNGVTTRYYLEGTNIIYEERNGTVIYYFYDESGVAGFEYLNQQDRNMKKRCKE
jgi:hypothetical protein